MRQTNVTPLLLTAVGRKSDKISYDDVYLIYRVPDTVTQNNNNLPQKNRMYSDIFNGVVTSLT